MQTARLFNPQPLPRLLRRQHQKSDRAQRRTRTTLPALPHAAAHPYPTQHVRRSLQIRDVAGRRRHGARQTHPLFLPASQTPGTDDDRDEGRDGREWGE